MYIHLVVDWMLRLTVHLTIPNIVLIIIIWNYRCDQVLKVAILAEKYAVDYTWYVDTILNLIRIAGDYVSEEVRICLPVAVCHFVAHRRANG